MIVAMIATRYVRLLLPAMRGSIWFLLDVGLCAVAWRPQFLCTFLIIMIFLIQSL